MPADFNRCQKNGGKIRTIEVGNGKYARVCILNGKTHMGEVREKAQASEETMEQVQEQAAAANKFTGFEVKSDGTQKGTKILVNGKEVENLSSLSFYWYGGMYMPLSLEYTIREPASVGGEFHKMTTYRLRCPEPQIAYAERATASAAEADPSQMFFDFEQSDKDPLLAKVDAEKAVASRRDWAQLR